MTEIAAHEWFRPRLIDLVAQAEQAGIARDVSVAVITDLINGPAFSKAPLQNSENWNQDIGEPDDLVRVNNPTSAQASQSDPIPDPMPFVGGNRWV